MAIFEPIKKELDVGAAVLAAVIGLVFGVLVKLGVPMTYKQASVFSGILRAACLGLPLVGTYLHEQNNKIVEFVGKILMLAGFASIGIFCVV